MGRGGENYDNKRLPAQYIDRRRKGDPPAGETEARDIAQNNCLQPLPPECSGQQEIGTARRSSIVRKSLRDAECVTACHAARALRRREQQQLARICFKLCRRSRGRPKRREGEGSGSLGSPAHKASCQTRRSSVVCTGREREIQMFVLPSTPQRSRVLLEQDP
ncbi:hypothetical protein BD311DRAFT_402245 [Dichomitus squalens]|uniref:Uncharacterized protein n=1 Tax=Dichomitus squalens TaxID=114155 RepID=A0A4Q9MKA5_9APHY|nr:hypothetical protein BD311DRAFT_402245 [Dichomitus squalens]